MKSILAIIIAFLSVFYSLFAANSLTPEIYQLIVPIQQFDSKNTFSVTRISKYQGKTTEFQLTNSKKQILRFEMTNNELVRQYCGTYFLLYQLDENNFLKEESRFQKNGQFINGMCETAPVVQYQILNLKKLKQRFEILNEWDGNKEMKEKAATAFYFDSKRKLIKKEKIDMNHYWKLCNFLYAF